MSTLSKIIQRIGEKCTRGGVYVADKLISKKWVNRIVKGEAIKGEYKGAEGFSPELKAKVRRFHAFDVVPKPPFATPPLTLMEADKVADILRSPSQDIAADVLSSIKVLNQLQNTKNATRQDFSLAEWKALDFINFELVKEHMEIAFELFQAGYGVADSDFWSSQGVDWRELVVSEVLTRAFAFTEELGGKNIALPTVLKDDSLALVEYSIKQVYLGDALPCYVLVSDDQKAPAWFVIRGTEFTPGGAFGSEGKYKEYRTGGRESVFADFIDSEGLGQLAVYKAMKECSSRPDVEEGYCGLDKIFRVALVDKRIIVTGHSLGGCLTNILAAFYGDVIDKAYALCAPGVSRDVANCCKQEIGDKLINIGIQGDLVPAVGELFIGKHVVMSGNKSFIEAHLDYLFNKEKQEFYLVDVEAENSSKMRQKNERRRQMVGSVMKLLADPPDWWVRRQCYRR